MSKVRYKQLFNLLQTKLVSNLLLLVIAIISSTYSFILALKRYNNFEFGKFDLGNMAQMVWNTANGRFMVVTDQFGSNMPRWGMSHVDPVLALFAPIYKLIPHPMLIVGFQHVFLISAIFPLFWFSYKILKNKIVSFSLVLTYIFYPAIGYILVWTGFHGISFVAPMFIWIVWFLNTKNFLVNESEKKYYVIYWGLIIFMLSGKEEVGAMLGIASFFLLLKNKKLAVQTFIISSLWFLISFFVIIPMYKNMRTQSVGEFLQGISAEDINDQKVTGNNFFLGRYGYLGNTYLGMVETVITKPNVVYKEITKKEKLETFKYLLSPFGFLLVLSPTWIIGLPDVLITVLSKEDIFNINNHRLSFVISVSFISYVYSLFWITKILEKIRGFNRRYFLIVISVLVLGNTVYLSEKSNNPLYVSGKSFIQNKIIPFTLAKEEREFKQSDIGYIDEADVPRNDIECLNDVLDFSLSENPRVYSGPDYLGAQMANREVNALFPARVDDANLFVVDIFEAKSFGAFGNLSWTLNKQGLTKLLNSDKYKHAFSCGKMFVFTEGHNIDAVNVVRDYNRNVELYPFELKDLKFYIGMMLPVSFSKVLISQNSPITIVVKKDTQEDFLDKVAFFEFKNVDENSRSYKFIDYTSLDNDVGYNELENGEVFIEKYNLPVTHMRKGKYRVYYGIGDLLNAKKIYFGDVKIQ